MFAKEKQIAMSSELIKIQVSNPRHFNTTNINNIF
jgi:hypothetical protein